MARRHFGEISPSSAYVALLEELALNAWPSAQTVFCDRWLLRFADGFARRANCVHLLREPPTTVRPGDGRAAFAAPSSLRALDQRIAYCRTLYRKAGLPTVIRVTPNVEFDAELELLGFRREDPSWTMVATNLAGASNLAERLPLSGPACRIESFDCLSDAWSTAYHTIEKSSPAARAGLQRVAERVAFQLVAVAAFVDSVPAGCAFGVVERDWVGVFNMVVAADVRRNGWGRRIMSTLLEKAMERGARNSYLHVHSENVAAIALYSSLGYDRAYPFWYRVESVAAQCDTG